MGMISTSSETVSQEDLGTRTYMAANSAMQAELQLLSPLNTRGICNANNVAPYNFQTALNTYIPELYDCEAFVMCNYYSDKTNSLAVVQYYRLTSTGESGTGTIETDSTVVVLGSRSIQVEGRSL